MATFVVYAIIALARHDNTILAAQAFTSLSLISLVTTPMLTFIQSIPSAIQCLGCLDRIQEYASVPCLYEDDEGQEREINKEYDSEISLRALPKSASTRKSLIRFSGYSVGWKDDGSPWQSVEGRSSALWMRFVL